MSHTRSMWVAQGRRVFEAGGVAWLVGAALGVVFLEWVKSSSPVPDVWRDVSAISFFGLGKDCSIACSSMGLEVLSVFCWHATKKNTTDATRYKALNFIVLILTSSLNESWCDTKPHHDYRFQHYGFTLNLTVFTVLFSL